MLQPRKLGALVTLLPKLAGTSVTWKTGPVSPELVTSGETEITCWLLLISREPLQEEDANRQELAGLQAEMEGNGAEGQCVLSSAT